MSHEGVIARTIMLDRQLRDIIKNHPDTAIVNVGAGFDDRFSRMDNGRILWLICRMRLLQEEKRFPSVTV